ncbi:phage tail assembly chaperone [uncultured Pseudodesulfovibrio sp.]
MSPTDRIEDLDAVAQAFRDVPQKKGFPWVIDWPVDNG